MDTPYQTLSLFKKSFEEQRTNLANIQLLRSFIDPF